jgi:hypothetical protein
VTPSELYTDLESLVSTKIVIQNILKLFRDEYAAKEEDVRHAVHAVFQDSHAQATVPSTVAALMINNTASSTPLRTRSYANYFAKHLKTAQEQLAAMSAHTFPANLRAELQAIINNTSADNPFETIGKLLSFRHLLPQKDDSPERRHQKEEIFSNISKIQAKLSLSLEEDSPLTADQLAGLKRELRHALCLKSEDKFL